MPGPPARPGRGLPSLPPRAPIGNRNTSGSKVSVTPPQQLYTGGPPKQGTVYGQKPTPAVAKVAPKPAAPKTPSLPATAGKTTVPARTVTAPTPPAKSPVKAPVAAKTPTRTAAAVPPRPASQVERRLPPTLTPQQQAQAAVNQSLAPLYAQQGTQATRQNSAITAFTKAIISQLQGMPSQVQGDYNNAIQGQTQLAQNAADSLRNANPNQQDQQLLSAINAPQSQHDAITSQNANTFNGGAAVGLYQNGVLPMDSLRSQGLAATELARLQPSFQGLRGQQALQAALAQQSDARGKIDALRPDLVQKYTSAQTAAQQKQQYLDMVAKKFGWQQAKDTASNTLATDRYNLSVSKYNASQTAANSKIDVRVSAGFKDGLAHTSTGVVVMSGGKPLQFDASKSSVTTKLPTDSQINTLIGQWKNGKVVSKTVRAPNPDANGNPVVKNVRTATGQLSFQQAYKRLLLMGYKDKQARGWLTTAYKRGEQGRGWLTNEERGTLKKDGRQTYVGYYKGHAFISLPQLGALAKAGHKPPGELVGHRWFIAPVY